MYAKGKEMERIKQILDNRTLLRVLLLLTVCTSFCLTSQAKGKVSFDYAKAVNNKDSQFTNTADINGDGKLDILAFKGGEDGFISWYEYPGFRRHIVRKGNFNAGRPLAADVDRDGDMDIVVAKKSNRHVYWYENPLPESNPTKGDWVEHHVGSTKSAKKGDYIKDYGVADFDRDGRKDIVVCTFADPADIFIYFQKDKNTWHKKTHTYANGHDPRRKTILFPGIVPKIQKANGQNIILTHTMAGAKRWISVTLTSMEIWTCSPADSQDRTHRTFLHLMIFAFTTIEGMA